MTPHFYERLNMNRLGKLIQTTALTFVITLIGSKVYDGVSDRVRPIKFQA